MERRRCHEKFVQGQRFMHCRGESFPYELAGNHSLSIECRPNDEVFK